MVREDAGWGLEQDEEEEQLGNTRLWTTPGRQTWLWEMAGKSALL